MKWFFILFLILNVAYLGWEIDRGTKQQRRNQQSAIAIPAGATRLQLVSELASRPEQRQLQEAMTEGYSDYSTSPVLPIAMNPNTENMIQTLLKDSSLMKMDDGLGTEEIDDLKLFSDEGDKTVCYTYGPIPDSNESVLMSEWLSQRGIEYVQRQTAEDGEQKLWVYLAPQASTEIAVATVMDLREQGISDLRLIRTGDLRNAISLGLFSTQAAVNRRLNEIKATGYQPVVVPYADGKQLHWFDVRIVQNSTYVDELFSGLPARFNAEPVKCNEIAMQ